MSVSTRGNYSKTRCRAQSSLPLLHQAVADSRYRLDIGRRTGLRLDLLAQPPDVNPDEFDFRAIARSPDTAEQRFMRHHHPGVLGQHSQELELGLAERDLLLSHRDAALAKVNAELASLEPRAVLRRRRDCLPASKRRSYAGQQLLQSQGLDQTVGGTQIE